MGGAPAKKVFNRNSKAFKTKTAGKTIADIEAFCSAELDKKGMLEEGTRNLYLKGKKSNQ